MVGLVKLRPVQKGKNLFGTGPPHQWCGRVVVRRDPRDLGHGPEDVVSQMRPELELLPGEHLPGHYVLPEKPVGAGHHHDLAQPERGGLQEDRDLCGPPGSNQHAGLPPRPIAEGFDVDAVPSDREDLGKPALLIGPELHR